MIFPAMPVILFRGSPSAVPWTVWTVIVWESVDLMFWGRPAPHVCNEIRESFSMLQPSAANGNSTPPVIFVLWIFWITAASLHGFPYLMFLGETVRHASKGFQLVTPAAFREPLSEIATRNYPRSSTGTFAFPFTIANECGNIPPAECFRDHVNAVSGSILRHDITILWQK